ncbi:MAG: hypothetical protein JRJ31_14865 [Deltaproteobacteria bacterium]|nr:hypothetical protein [Deltaproteobacteria bacterium]
MKILITGIGNIGKSSLREMVAHKFPGQVIQIDMDYHNHQDIPESSDKVVVVEDVHGLERNPEQYDKIVYLMPPSNHFVLWMRRAWAWFSGGVVDLSAPKGVNRPYAFSNIPVIVKIVLRNIISAKRWVLGDMETIRNKLEEKTVIVKNVTEGLREIDTFVSRSEKEGAKLNLLN